MKKKLVTGIIATVLVASLGLTGCGSGSGGSGGGDQKGGNVIIAGSTSVQPLSEVMAEAYMAKDSSVKIEVQGGGSGQGIKSIEEKIADIGSLSREVKDEEKSAVATEYVIAKDGIAVIVNPSVKVDDLTIDQIRDIYTGTIKNWKEVGGDDKPIAVVTREEGSGTRGAFTEITGVLEKDDAGNETDKTTKDALVQPSTGAVSETVSKTPDSIGYVSLGALADGMKAITVEGTEASIDTVLSGAYKIQRPFVYVTGAEVSDAAKAYLDFVMGAEGQKIVEENGFIPVK